jgi:ATP-binding cassette subfamily F protein 3
MEAVFAEVFALEARAADLLTQMGEAEGQALDAVMAEYDDVSTKLEAENAYAVEHRIKEVTGGLGFPLDELDMPVQHLSGGQRTRAALARTLLEEPDLLLLDGNHHLDLDAIDWLVRYLTATAARLMVSHDLSARHRHDPDVGDRGQRARPVCGALHAGAGDQGRAARAAAAAI